MSLSVERWTGRLSPNTATVYMRAFNLFNEWLEKQETRFSTHSPDQLIDYQKNAGHGSRYDILDLIQSFVTQKNIRNSTKIQYYSTMRSFFLHNRAALPDDPSFITRSDKPPVKGTLTLDDVKKICLKSNKTYRAIFLSMFQGGMDQASFEYWNLNGYDDLVQQMGQGRDIVKVELPGRKRNKNKRRFYTFVGSDAVQAIKDYFKERPGSQGAIFLNQHDEPVNKKALRVYWIRKVKALSIIEVSDNPQPSTRYGKNLHEIRDLFRSQWSKSPANHVVGEYIMGHQIDDLGYDKSFRDVDYYRKEYKKALPQLQLMSSSVPFGLVQQDKIEELEAKVAEYEKAQGLVSQLARRLEVYEKKVEELEKKQANL